MKTETQQKKQINNLIKDLRETETDAINYLRTFADDCDTTYEDIKKGKFINDTYTNRAYDLATFNLCKRTINELQEITEGTAEPQRIESKVLKELKENLSKVYTFMNVLTNQAEERQPDYKEEPATQNQINSLRNTYQQGRIDAIKECKMILQKQSYMLRDIDIDLPF